jgi:hypothetical protein
MKEESLQPTNKCFERSQALIEAADICQIVRARPSVSLSDWSLT